MSQVVGHSNERFVRRLAVGLLVGWLFLHGVWRLLDHTPPRGDQTFYVNGAAYIQKTWPLPWSIFIRKLNDVTWTDIRPPGGSLLLAPWLVLFDNNLRLAGLGAVVWHALTLVALYLLGRRWFDATTGCFAGVFYICLPIIYETYIDPEFYFMTLLPLALLCCAHLWDDSRWRWTAWLGMGLITAGALLCKWVFAVYLLGPMIVLGFDWVRRFCREADGLRFVSRMAELALMIAPVLLVAIFWYWPNRDVLANAFQLVAESRQFTPFKEGWTWAVLGYYPGEWIRQNKLFPLVFAVIGMGAPILPAKIREWMRLEPGRYRAGYLLLLASLLGSWVYFCIRYDNIPIKYIFALQPILALLAVGWIRMIPRLSLRMTVYAILLFYGLSCAVWMHFGSLSWIGPSQLPRLVSIENHFWKQYALPIAQPPHTQEWPQDAIAQTVLRMERESPIPLDASDAIKPVVVLPDLYYFDWRSVGVSLRLQALDQKQFDLQESSLHDSNGLLRLATARYIVASRGQVSRFHLDEQDAMGKNSLAFNRLIDAAPQWFWKNYRLVAQYALPYGLADLQLYRRVCPLDDEEAEGLCEFWLSYHQGEADAWNQIVKIWSMRRDRARLARAERILANLDGLSDGTLSWIDGLHNEPDLRPYEMLELGEPFLSRCAESDSWCAWKAAWMVGEIERRNHRFDRAESVLLQAWRMQRERPEILSSLIACAQQAKHAQAEALYRQFLPYTINLLNNNRRPILYQEAAYRLMEEGWTEDGFWFALQGFVVGLNRFPNTKPLHLALQGLNRSWTDYETLPLPFARRNEQEALSVDYPLSLKAGETYVFPFLNLDGGTYRLRWKHILKSPTVLLSFSLDETALDAQIYPNIDPSTEADPFSGEFVFESPMWGDRLRIDCIQGEAQLHSFVLQRTQAEIPFIEYDGSLNVRGKNYHEGSYSPDEGFSFVTDSDWVRLNFHMHSDPRAWRGMRIESHRLETPSALFTFIVRDEENREHEVEFSHPLNADGGEDYATLPIPESIRQYPFLLGVRMQLNDLQDPNPRCLKRIQFYR